MKKDIFKGFVALMFLFLALVVVAQIDNKKESTKEQNKKTKLKEFTNYYKGEVLNKDYNLPIVVIDTNKSSIKKDEKTIGNIQIYDNKDGLNNLGNDPEIVSKASFKIRGNSTSKYPKKQYSIELLNKKGKEKKINTSPRPTQREKGSTK